MTKLIIIKFIGVVLLFHTPGPNPVKFTALLPDGRKPVIKCGKQISEHRAYVRIIGDVDTSATTWPVDAKPCVPAAKCKLYEITNDEIEITPITQSTVGVTQLPNLDKIVPKLTDYFITLHNDFDLSAAKAKSVGSIELNAGEMGGDALANDMRIGVLQAQPGPLVTAVTIHSKNHNKTIVVPFDSEIAILNLPPDIAHAVPGAPHSGHVDTHPEHWFLHYELGGHDPRPNDCTTPTSFASAYRMLDETIVTLSKECSATTYP